MSKRNLVGHAILSLVLILVCASNPLCIYGADANPLGAGIETFTSPDGTNYFALCLKPGEAAPAAGPRNVAVLFNTSASQSGEFRVKALEALKGLLKSLPANDRVRLVAVDLNAVPLTNDFVAPQSGEMTAALAALDARVPLGATDMEKALNTVANSSPGEIIYIGDGRSAANLLQTDQFAKLVDNLAGKRIPVTSYVIGARMDAQLPGALAVQTGGTVIFDSEAITGEQAGQKLAAAAGAAVLWPTEVKWPDAVAEVYPKRLPPLRSDRETVVFGKLKENKAFDVEVSAQGPGGPEKLVFAAPAGVSDDSNSYLAQMTAMAQLDGGITLPLLGAASLDEARQVVGIGAENLTRLARQALSSGNIDSAEKLVGEALRQDPNNTEALAVQGALKKAPAGGAAPAGEVVAGTNASAPTADDAPAAGGATDLNLIGVADAGMPPGAMAEGFEHDRRVVSQMIQTEVQNTLNQARSIMSVQPEVASQQLKLVLEKVRKTGGLNPDVRDQLVDVIQASLREAAKRKIEVDAARQQRLANEAAAQERLMIANNLVRKQEKIKQLMDRFDSLMKEGRYQLAEDAAAAEAKKLDPENPALSNAMLDARLVGNYQNMMVLRDMRQKAVIDTLYQVEKSFMPFPDDPPIVYPDAELWQQLSKRRKEKYSSMDLASKGPAEEKISKALKSTTQLEFIETPLSDVVDYLKDLHGIEIQLDNRALTDVGIGSDTPVTKNLKGVTLRSALRLMLRELSLTYIIQDEVLLITTPEEAEARLSTKVYPVADLVIPIETPAISGMGGMGGMMGGMGGMMGGMGGMGMGGMGGMGMGGMGGMGMGGMGGMGMFNLPRELLPKIPPGGFKAFAVEDHVPATKDQPAKEQVVEVPSLDNHPAKIEIEIEKGAKPEAVWDQYFSKNQPQPAAVRDAVRRLMDQQQFDHVVALIGSALRHQQGQPWMYEAMALALDAAGRPKEEIERAVMSAVDFVDNTADLMYIGAYLAQIGLNERALQVYRQAAQIDPIRPEPYMLGLRAARALDDLEGLKWASLGILSQAWPKEQTDVWQAGVGVAKEVLDKLRAEKRTKEADAFLAALDDAVARDCMVVVTWTGEADLDVMVEEPSGTICSLRTPRTTAGGVLLGDAVTQAGRDSYGGHSEVYVCPKGFDGTYRMLIRRVWGNVTTGKVNVEVVTHYRTANAVDVRKKIALDKDEALVAFDLTNGRRKESLREQQVANAAGGQLALNRQILAQQLNSALDPAVMQALAASRASGAYNSGGNGGGTSGFPFFGGGAVGYQPVIITLPEGTNFMVQGVISADRRYVRVTTVPFFSGVGEVNTFNMATGANESGRGGTGGQGFSGMFGGGGGICFGGTFKNIQDVPGALFPYRGEHGAVVVTATDPESPGYKAGFCEGDVIFRFEGEMLPPGDTIMLLRDKVIPLKLKGNETRTIGVLRDGVELELKVTWPEWKWLKPSDELRDLPDYQARGAA